MNRQYQTKKYTQFFILSLCFLIMSAGVFYLYCPTFNTPPFFDTLFIINPQIQNFITLHMFGTIRWLTNVTFAINYRLWGDNMQSYRIINTALHCANGVMLYVFLQQIYTLIQSHFKLKTSNIKILAFFGALIMIFNPVSVYATLYIVQRSILLATFLGFVFLIIYIEGLKKKSHVYFLLSALVYALCIAAKEHAVLLPAFALIVTLSINDPRAAIKRHLWLPFSLYALALFDVLLKQRGIIAGVYERLAPELVQSQAESYTALTSFSDITETHLYALSIFNQATLFFKYIFLWLFPDPRWISINIAQAFPTSLWQWPTTFGLAAFLCVPYIAYRLIKTKTKLVFVGLALLYPWILFLTEFSLIRVHESFVLYRTYLWMGGLCIAFPYIFARFARPALWFVIALTLLLFWIVTLDRIETLKSPLNLWQDAAQKIEHDPNKTYPLSIYRTYSNLATYQALQGQYDQALKNYEKALQIYPGRYQALHSISDIYFKRGDFPKAHATILKVIEMAPDYAGGWFSLARIEAETGDPQQAIKFYLKTIELNPNYESTHFNLANVYTRLKNWDKAIQNFQMALSLNPFDKDSHYNLANTFFMKGDLTHAIQSYKKVIQIDPHYIRAYHNLATSYLKMNDENQARLYYLKALEINPNFELSRRALENIQP